jgi:hydrogenase nickel incorporation protein HypA/HybF
VHELSIAKSIVDIVQQYVPEEQRGEVQSVRVQVGRLSGVVPESLEFCFSAITDPTPLGSARLDIEQIPARSRCAQCSSTFESEGTSFLCPSCGGDDLQILSGMELHVVEVELAKEHAQAK